MSAQVMSTMAGTNKYLLSLRIMLILVLAVGLVPFATVDSVAVMQPRPAKVRVTKTGKTKLALTWSSAGDGLSYQVTWAKNKKFKKAKTMRVSKPSATLNKLKKNTKYYIKVRVVDGNGVALSSYSKVISKKTLKKTPKLRSPKKLKVTKRASGEMTLAWRSVPGATNYRVQVSQSAKMKKAKTYNFSGTSGTIPNLKSGTKYYFRVRAMASGWKKPSAYSKKISKKTLKSSSLRVASYNVSCANCYLGVNKNEKTWYERRNAVVSTIKAQHLDVIGIQEASQGWLSETNQDGGSLTQFEDLVNRLGAPYKLTNLHRNNCTNSTTPTNCVYKDQGASQGTKIIYNSAKVTLIDQGSKKLSELSNNQGSDRYLAWAIFKQKATGKQFFFANTHLADGKDAKGSSVYNNLRLKQTKELLKVVKAKNPRKLQTLIVGDFNSHKWTEPSNAPYNAMKKAGYVDPLGNTYKSTKKTKGATVVKRIRTNYSSFNGFQAKAPKFKYKNGTYIDYIWTSKGISVQEWETVMRINSAGKYVGIIPSDHNMIRATVILR